MSPFDAYKLFISIKMHFGSPSYDALKYNFKVNASIDSFHKRQDKYHFSKLANLKDPKGYLIANFVDGDSNWIGDLVSSTSDEIYTKWLRRQESLTYMIESDLSNLSEPFIQHFRVVDGQHPSLLRLVRQKRISLETLVALNEVLNFFPIWDMKITDTLLWPPMRNKCLKYQSFLHYDRKKVKKLVLDLVKLDK